MPYKPSIAIQLPDLSEEYPALLLKGAYNAAKELDITLSVLNIEPFETPYEYSYQTNFLFDLLCSNFFDAVVLASCTLINYISKNTFESLVERLNNKPLVSIGIQLKNIPSILVDNKTGIQKAVEHLINIHKKRNIAFIKGPLNNLEANERYLAFVDSIKKFGLTFKEELIFQGDFSISSGEKIAEEIFEKKDEIDAIISANDSMAIGLIKKLKEMKIKIPEDIAIIGFDDIENARFLSPTLSTIKQPIYKQGYIAIKTAYDIIKKRDFPLQMTLPCIFIERESCGCKNEPAQRRHFSISKENLFRELKNFLEMEEISLKNIEYIYLFFQNLLAQFENSSFNETGIIDSTKKLVSKLIEDGEDILFLNKIFDMIDRFFPSYACTIEKCKGIIYENKNFSDNLLRKEKKNCERNLERFFGKIYTSINHNEWLKNIMEMILNLKFPSFYIFKFLNPILHKQGENFSKSEIISLILSEKLKSNLKIISSSGIKTNFNDFISNFEDEDTHLYFVISLYFREYIYGYIVIEGEPIIAEYLDKIAMSISNSFFTLSVLENLASETKVIKQKNTQMENELFLAELLQRNILPKSPPVKNIDFYIKYKERVGGDFFDFISFREKDWTGIFIADVSGHGVPTAIITSALKSSILQLRSFLTKPADFMIELNDTIYSMAREGFFVTAFYGIYKKNENKFLFSNAGHNHPYVIYENNVTQLNCMNTGPALGVASKEEILNNNKAYTDEEIILDGVKKIVFYTDGLTETSSIKNPEADFENFVLKSLFFNNRELDAKDFIKVVRENLILFHGSSNFEDDVTFICLDLVNI